MGKIDVVLYKLFYSLLILWEYNFECACFALHCLRWLIAGLTFKDIDQNKELRTEKFELSPVENMTPYEADTLFESTDDKSQIFPKAKIGLQTCVENHGLAVLKVDTVRPWDTRPQAARTLQVHVFELGPKKFEMNEFMEVKTLSSTIFWSSCLHPIKQQKLHEFWAARVFSLHKKRASQGITECIIM